MTQEFKALKFRIANEDQSKQLQEVLFQLGYKWWRSKLVPQHTDKPFLYTSADGDISYSGCRIPSDDIFFKSNDRTEQNTEEFIKMHTKPVVKKHKWYDVIVAAAEGRTVQLRSEGGKWSDYEGSMAIARLSWLDGFEYRVKPEPVEVWQWAYGVKGFAYTTGEHYSTVEAVKADGIAHGEWFVKLEPTKRLTEQ